MACIADSDTALNHQRVKSMCLLDTLNVRPFEKKYLSIQKPSANVQVRKYANGQVPRLVFVQVVAQVLELILAQVLAQVKCPSM